MRRARAAGARRSSASRRKSGAGRASGATRTASPLAGRLEVPAKATARELFDLARRWWTEGRRFDIGQLARELGLSRATVFRWVGSRELLYGEVIATQFAEAMARARADAKGAGPAFVADVTRRLMTELLENEPLRTFIQQDTELAMRVLMSKSSTVELRCAQTVREALAAAVAGGLIRPELELEALAYLIVRIGESFLYRDAITGDPPDIEPAITAIELLLTGKRAG